MSKTRNLSKELQAEEIEHLNEHVGNLKDCITSRNNRLTECHTIAELLHHGDLFATRDTIKEAHDYALSLMTSSGMSEFHAITALAVLLNTVSKEIKSNTSIVDGWEVSV